MNFIDYCKEHIEEKIYNYVGSTHYGADFTYTITEEENANGTLTFSRETARNILGEWWYDCGDYWEYEKDNFGEHAHNPFDEPEAYMVCMVIEGVNAILANEPHIEESWNDKLELTEEVIEDIKEYVKEFDGEIF